MADVEPANDVLANLEVLLEMDILVGQKEWELVRDLDKLPPAVVVNSAVAAESQKKDDGNGK